MWRGDHRGSRWRGHAPHDDAGDAQLEGGAARVSILFFRLSTHSVLTVSFLSMPSIGWTKVEQHPFSFANCPVDGSRHEAVFLIKAEQGE